MEQLTRETLRRLYVEELLTESEIAERYGTYQVKINRLRKKWGIPTLGKTGRRTAKLPALTERQRELILGSLLGDGYLVAPSEHTASFNESHSIKQRDYLHWKGDILGPHCSSYTKTTKREGDRVFHGERLTGIASTYMREFYDLFYPAPDRVRVFPSDLYKRLTPFALAVWYLDDGGLMHRFHPRITYGLDSLSLYRAKRALRTLGLDPKVHDGNRSHTITFPGQDRLFFEIVGPHIPECMKHKLPNQDTPRRLADKNAKTLAPERARVLYEGGLSLSQIASLYDVGRSTVRRRILSTGASTRRPGRKSVLLSREAADEFLSQFDPAKWESLSESERDGWVADAFEGIRKAPFPYPQHLKDSEFARQVGLVENTNTRLEGVRIQPWSHVGSRACLPYFPNRYQAASKGRRTAFEAWHDDKVLKWAIRFQLRMGDPVLLHRVLRAVTMRHRTPSVFRATVAKFIYETYGTPGEPVWDPCSGYGGRLLGAFVAGVPYIGTDVDSETVQGNLGLAERLGSDAAVHQCPAEEFDPGPVSLVFTSPPYFDQERYSKASGQSWVQHGASLDAWVEGFMLPVFEMAWGRLPTGGHLVWNIADIKQGRAAYPLVERSIQAAQAVGFRHEATLEMPLAKLNREDPFEPVLVFVKL